MINFKEKQIFIDGKETFLLSGELHYYRQPQENWQPLIDEAKALGLNCIASYVPWILHEEVEGEYNFSGNLDLGAFIDLCKQNGLHFIVRPGPFIMAEMKKEGIPYWVAKKHKSAIPVGFDGEAVIGNTLDYLDEGYLGECKKWYKKIMAVVEPRLNKNGGNIIGVQLDNEIGMLNWVTNKPVLNDNVLSRFISYLSANLSVEQLSVRYPFSLTKTPDTYEKLRSPSEDFSVAFHLDLGRFLRTYYADYVEILREYALDCGITQTPFLINIHGTGDSRIFDYPLGVSQLSEAYNRFDDIISGTDVYLGEPTEGTYQDMYISNVITDCMNKKQSPLTSIEFGCSDGGYMGFTGMRINPTAPAHQMMICASQNMRMINFYVFNGGENYMLSHPEHDGCGRMAFTGEKHCWNAPVRPDMTHNYSFDHIATTAKAIHAVNNLVGKSRQVIDGVTLGFIPDYFLTETAYPKSEKIKTLYQNLKDWRCAGRIDSVARAFLANHINFDAVDIQDEPIKTANLLFVLSARYMDCKVQEKLVAFVKQGGRVLIYGELPEYDMEGNSCTLLLHAMGLTNPRYMKSVTDYYLSYDCSGSFKGVAESCRGAMAQVFDTDNDSVLSIGQNGGSCGFKKPIGDGLVYAITCDYPAQLDFYGKLLADMGIKPSAYAKYYRRGIYLSRTKSNEQQLLYIVNLDAANKVVDIVLEDNVLFKDFTLSQKASYILPINVVTSLATIVKSTAELCGTTDSTLTFRLSQPSDEITLKTDKNIAPDESYTVTGEGNIMTVTSKVNALMQNEMIIKFV